MQEDCKDVLCANSLYVSLSIQALQLHWDQQWSVCCCSGAELACCWEQGMLAVVFNAKFCRYAIFTFNYCKLSKMFSSPFWTLLWGQNGKEVFAPIFNYSCAYAPHPQFLMTLTMLTIKMTMVKICWTFTTDTKPRNIKATCVISRSLPFWGVHGYASQW